MDRVFIAYCLVSFTIFSVIHKASSAAVETKTSGGPTPINSKSKGAEKHHGAPIIYPAEPQQAEPLDRGGTLFDDPTPCPDNALFCEATNDYPKDLISNKLKKQPKLLLDILYEEELGDDSHNKLGPDSEPEVELCTSTAKIIYPTKAQSKEGIFEFVVNDEQHKQGIRVETCTSTGGECKMMPKHILPLDYQSSCVQKYILRTLVVLNRNSSADVQGFVTKPFEFPSCCSCVITMSSTHNRFGGEHDDTTPANVNVTVRPTPRPSMGKPKS